ncbi:MAG: hypothetical protein R3F49_07720 [Planctomycetota bacterium]
MFDELAALAAAVRDAGAAELARLRVGAERLGLALGRAVVLAATGIVLLGTAVVLIVLGLVGGIGALTGWPWWLSALTLGCASPAIGYLTVLGALARRDRRRARRLAKGKPSQEPSQRPSQDVTS